MHGERLPAQDVLDSHERLRQAGLVAGPPIGLNAAGLEVLGDLLAVLMVQTGSGSTTADRLVSETARAMLSALADLTAEWAGEPTEPHRTWQLLTQAAQTLRNP